MRRILTAFVIMLMVGTAHAASVPVTGQFTDNADNEGIGIAYGFELERATAASVAACQTATGFTLVKTIPPSLVALPGTVLFTDTTPGIEGSVSCYRVRAANSAGFSGYSNIAGKLLLIQPPSGAPTSLSLN